MRLTFYILIFVIFGFGNLQAQTNPADGNNQTAYGTTPDPLQNISQQVNGISKSINSLNKSIKELLEKFAAGKGMQLSERQQKLLLGFEVLNRAEQRLEILQKFQIELAQKDGEVKTRLAQVDEALLPGSVERNTAFIGTTKGEELREGRRKALETERRSLQTLTGQISRNLQQNSEELRQAESFVNVLRRKVLPAIESEISDL
jgi:hypothetical protein